MRMRWWYAILALVAMIVSLVSCGGGGGGGSVGTPAAQVSAFATDDMNAGFDHVWVTIKSIDLQGASGATNLFTDATGVTVDLKTLRDASGNRFRLINRRTVPAGTYTGVTVTVANSAAVFTTGATTAINATFSSDPSDFVMSLTFPAAINVTGPANDLCVDFKLSNWTLTGTTISATGGQFLGIGDKAHIGDPNRHEASELHGVVSGLTGDAGAQTFTVTNGANSASVVTTTSTAIVADGGATLALANGQNVEVRGFWDATANTLTATRIEIHNGSETSHGVGARGALASVATDRSSITLTVREADFHPKSTSVTVDLSTSTKFYGNKGAVITSDQFFTAATLGSQVEAKGTIDATSGHLVATAVKLCDGEQGGGGDQGGSTGGGGDKPGIFGPETSFNADAKTFVLTVVDMEHVNVAAGATVNVSYTTSTQWFWDGSSVDLSTLLTKLAAGRYVMVLGSFSGTTFVATQVYLRS